jgi:hypothetical protein
MSVLAPDLAARLGVGPAAALPAPATTGGDAAEGILPVPPPLAALLPAGGLRRGSVVQVERSGALALALLGRASAEGAWCALVGLPTVGLLAAAELGLDLDRLALVPDPGPDWPSVVAAFVDALDIIVLAPPTPLAPARTRRLAARVRERGAVLVVHGRWEGSEVRLAAVAQRCHGIGAGHGRLTGYTLQVESRGRGAAARPRRAARQIGDPPYRDTPPVVLPAGPRAA